MCRQYRHKLFFLWVQSVSSICLSQSVFILMFIIERVTVSRNATLVHVTVVTSGIYFTGSSELWDKIQLSECGNSLSFQQTASMQQWLDKMEDYRRCFMMYYILRLVLSLFWFMCMCFEAILSVAGPVFGYWMWWLCVSVLLGIWMTSFLHLPLFVYIILWYSLILWNQDMTFGAYLCMLKASVMSM